MKSLMLSLALVGLACTTTSCKFIASKLVQRVDRWADGTPKREGTLADGMQTGEWVYNYPDGRRRAAGSYANDQRVGAWTFWFEGGGVEKTGTFDEAGKRSGEWTYYHPNGVVRARGAFAGDVEVGRWQFFDADETLVREGAFDAGRLTGAWTYWHADGKRKATGMMRHGQRVGTWQLWDESGTASSHDFGGGGGGGGGVATPAMPSVESQPAEIAAQVPEPSTPRATQPEAEQETPQTAPEPVPTAAPEQVAALEAEPERIPASFQQSWTILQEDEVENYVLDYLEGRSKKRLSRKKYGSKKRGKRAKSGPRRRSELEGAPLPVTSFTNIDGETIDTTDFAGEKRVMVVVLRGFAGEVCVYCVAQTEALARAQPQLDALDLEVLVIYPGPKGNEKAFLEAYRSTFGRDAPPYDVFYDPDLELVGKLGISGGDLAFPTTIITDKAGVVQYAYVGDHRADRPAAKKLIELIEGMQQ